MYLLFCNVKKNTQQCLKKKKKNFLFVPITSFVNKMKCLNPNFFTFFIKKNFLNESKNYQYSQKLHS